MVKHPFFMEIEAIQPSQLYLNAQKIKKIKNKYKIIAPEHIEAVPIKKLNNDIIFTDGHTRAYLLWLYGFKKIKVEWEDEDLDWEVYQICIDWCKEEGITSISDLDDKIINNESYQIKWIKRCHDMFTELEKKRKEKI